MGPKTQEQAMTQAVEDAFPHSEDEWSHIRETINMLCLAVCQIEATMVDSNRSVDTLTDSFTKLVTHSSSVSKQIESVSELSELKDFKEDIAATTQEMQSNVNKSIEAFQFYDRVCQRLDNVARGLERVSELMANEEHVFNPEEWNRLQDRIKSSYTMEAERIMFEYIMRGGKVKDALQIYRHKFEEKSPDQDNDDVEFF